MKFKWDESKNRINIRNHGIDFSDVKKMFDGPMIVNINDRYHNRIISARKAGKYECKEFEKEIKDRLG